MPYGRAVLRRLRGHTPHRLGFGDFRGSHVRSERPRDPPLSPVPGFRLACGEGTRYVTRMTWRLRPRVRYLRPGSTLVPRWGSYPRGRSVLAFENYLRFERGFAEGTIRSYGANVIRFGRYLRRSKRPSLERAEREDVRAFMRYLTTCDRVSGNSVRSIIGGVRSYYRFLLDEEVVAEDPTDRLRLPRVTRPLPRFLSKEEAIALLEEGPDPRSPFALRDRAVLEFLYATGCRNAELRALEVGDVDLEEGTARVFGKGAKERVVLFHRKAGEALKAYLTDRIVGSPVFLEADGSGLTKARLGAIVREAQKRAGIAGRVTPHTLRHSFATHMIEGGADLVSLARLMGHADVVTLEVYVHLSQGHLRRAHALHPRTRAGELVKLAEELEG